MRLVVPPKKYVTTLSESYGRPTRSPKTLLRGHKRHMVVAVGRRDQLMKLVALVILLSLTRAR